MDVERPDFDIELLDFVLKREDLHVNSPDFQETLETLPAKVARCEETIDDFLANALRFFVELGDSVLEVVAEQVEGERFRKKADKSLVELLWGNVELPSPKETLVDFVARRRLFFSRARLGNARAS